MRLWVNIEVPPINILPNVHKSANLSPFSFLSPRYSISSHDISVPDFVHSRAWRSCRSSGWSDTFLGTSHWLIVASHKTNLYRYHCCLFWVRNTVWHSLWFTPPFFSRMIWRFWIDAITISSVHFVLLWTASVQLVVCGTFSSFWPAYNRISPEYNFFIHLWSDRFH